MVHKFGLLVLVFLVGLLAACGQDEIVEEVVLVTKTAVSTPTPSPIPSHTPTHTATPTQTPSPTATSTATATTIPTLTPLPTFAPEELETAVADLLANPMNCDVPCWWGAIPGKTTAFEIEQLLAPYQFAEYWYEKEQQPNFITLWFYQNIKEEPFYFPVDYIFENHFLKTIYTGWAPPPDNILRIYGKPDEIRLTVLGTYHEWFSPIWLNLVYFEENMAIGYLGNGTISDDKLTGCFSDTKMRSTRINSSINKFEDDNFNSIYFAKSPHLLLEEATNLTMEEFMQQFSNPTQPQCLETPIELWE